MKQASAVGGNLLGGLGLFESMQAARSDSLRPAGRSGRCTSVSRMTAGLSSFARSTASRLSRAERPSMAHDVQGPDGDDDEEEDEGAAMPRCSRPSVSSPTCPRTMSGNL
jgi:hypothetical protein